MKRALLAVFAVMAAFTVAGAHRTTVVVGAGVLSTGELFEVAAFDAGDRDGGVLRYRAGPDAAEAVISVDCVSVSWSLVPLSLSHVIALSGEDQDGKRHHAVLMDVGPGTLAADHARFMPAGQDACGVTFGPLRRVDGFVDAT
ncbi:MAG TPA: hypothetical protein VM841_02490 [Actinomycetota bacterium]|nr:hypothetical protein [Actinomycetota bacterium]